jgi:hypothetical protein
MISHPPAPETARQPPPSQLTAAPRPAPFSTPNPVEPLAPQCRTRRCGRCRRCLDDARWERIFQEKFADPTYYDEHLIRYSSPLA